VDKKNMYESMFIVYTGDDEETSRNKVLDDIQAELKKQKGKVVAVQPMGKRTFAYHIGGKKDGYYFLINFEAPPQSLQKLVDRFKINTSILRQLILKVDKFTEFKEISPAGVADKTAEPEEIKIEQPQAPAYSEPSLDEDDDFAEEESYDDKDDDYGEDDGYESEEPDDEDLK